MEGQREKNLNQNQRAMTNYPSSKFIKGTMVLDLVKAIKGFKDKPWDTYLSEEAKALLSQKILPSSWYPVEPVLSCLWAVYKLIGNENPALAKEWGKVNGRKVFETIYKNLIVPMDPEDTLKKLEIIAKGAFIKGVKIESVQMGGKHFKTKIYDDNPKTEPAYYFIQGWIEVLLETTGGKNIKVEIIEKHWQGAEATVFDIKWE